MFERRINVASFNVVFATRCRKHFIIYMIECREKIVVLESYRLQCSKRLRVEQTIV